MTEKIINYPTRIHCVLNCQCTRISNMVSHLKLIGEEIIYVIERINHNNHLHNKKYIIVTEKEGESNAITILKEIFGSSLDVRKYVISYFNSFEWSPRASIQIRKIIRTINTIGFCPRNLTIDESTCNSGFIIIGNIDRIKSVSHCFNKYIPKTEFTILYYIKLADVRFIRKAEMGHSINNFVQSDEYKYLKKFNNMYALIGLTADEYLKKPGTEIYNLPFGKREWCLNMSESSLCCAKRELYEEFNIQISESLWNYSKSLNLPQKVHIPGFLLHILYLNTNSKIGHHKDSQTLYLSH